MSDSDEALPERVEVEKVVAEADFGEQVTVLIEEVESLVEESAALTRSAQTYESEDYER